MMQMQFQIRCVTEIKASKKLMTDSSEPWNLEPKNKKGQMMFTRKYLTYMNEQRRNGQVSFRPIQN